MVTFLHLHLRATHQLMSKGHHQLYLIFCGHGCDLFALKSTFSVGVGVGMGVVTFLHLHLKASDHLMSNGSHQLYLIFCGCGHDLFCT